MPKIHRHSAPCECLPLFQWATERTRREVLPSTSAGRWLARRGVPTDRANLVASLLGYGLEDRR